MDYQTRPHRVRFGVFEVDLYAGELFKNGIKLRLSEQPFQLLTALLERPGEVVSREELQRRLWAGNTNVEFDRSLNTAASKLRDVLDDSAETPRFIQTLPKRGYRFIAPISEPVATPQPRRTAWLRGNLKQAIAAAILILALVAAYAWRAPSSVPRVTRIVQLSNDGFDKGTALATDGPRIYFTASQGASQSVAQISDGGGDTELMAAASFGPELAESLRGISRDHHHLLLAARAGTAPADYSIWSVTVNGQAPRRLGLVGHDADWSRDGRRIAYVRYHELWLADSDGKNAHRLREEDRGIFYPRWSPDGKRIRFTVTIPHHTPWLPPDEGVILEIAAEGGAVRRVFPDRTVDHWDGRWTDDGKYFVFNSGNDIWAVRDTAGSKPVQLTYGPLRFRAAVPSPDGRTLYAIGTAPRGELLRYDIQQKRFVPVFIGLSADSLNYSHDGQWLVYVTYPQGELWRSRMDRTQRQQLTTAPMKVMLPSWSPDGREIVFSGRMPGQAWKEYLIGAEGGTPKEIAAGPNPDGTWSPDGRIVAASVPVGPTLAKLMFLDVHTGKNTPIPGSDGIFAPRVSPDGRYIVAMGVPRWTMLFDVGAQVWSQIGPVCSSPSWNADSTGFICIDKALVEIRQFDLHTRQFRTLVRPAQDRLTGNAYGAYLGLAPDGSPLVLREVGSEEIYALEWGRE
jgi:DNA-binding winged helix-turn-helix (wHTH) protein/Tol biopolymer transport system component